VADAVKASLDEHAPTALVYINECASPFAHCYKADGTDKGEVCVDCTKATPGVKCGGPKIPASIVSTEGGGGALTLVFAASASVSQRAAPPSAPDTPPRVSRTSSRWICIVQKQQARWPRARQMGSGIPARRSSGSNRFTTRRLSQGCSLIKRSGSNQLLSMCCFRLSVSSSYVMLCVFLWAAVCCAWDIWRLERQPLSAHRAAAGRHCGKGQRLLGMGAGATANLWNQLLVRSPPSPSRILLCSSDDTSVEIARHWRTIPGLYKTTPGIIPFFFGVDRRHCEFFPLTAIMLT
jgi:hypothetical protein